LNDEKSQNNILEQQLHSSKLDCEMYKNEKSMLQREIDEMKQNNNLLKDEVSKLHDENVNLRTKLENTQQNV